MRDGTKISAQHEILGEIAWYVQIVDRDSGKVWSDERVLGLGMRADDEHFILTLLCALGRQGYMVSMSTLSNEITATVWQAPLFEPIVKSNR